MLLKRGLSVRQVAVELGLSKSTVARVDFEAKRGIERCEYKRLSLLDEERDYICGLYLRSNAGVNKGSLSFACYVAATDFESPLRVEVRGAILESARRRRGAVPYFVARDCGEILSSKNFEYYRGGRDAVVKSGVFVPGALRLDAATGNIFAPGVRQVWDDASVNVGVVVPWRGRSNAGVNKWGCRVARFQLLLGIDAGCDFCVGYHYVIRENDSYNGSDVVQAFDKVWGLAGGHPREIVLEGGSWQSKRVLDYLGACGVEVVSAKGRPNQKLVEGYFNRLWTTMSIFLPATGQVGRFRGEMSLEKGEWDRARRGVIDPRLAFPELGVFLEALDKSITLLNNKLIQSLSYGDWVPSVVYRDTELLAMPVGLEGYVLPISAVRKVCRGGIVSVSADCIYGYRHQFVFAVDKGYVFDGASVRISFDNRCPERGAFVKLEGNFRHYKCGLVIDSCAVLINDVPEIRYGDGKYTCGWLDNMAVARGVKRKYLTDVASVTKAFDVRGGKVARALPKACHDFAGSELPEMEGVIRDESAVVDVSRDESYDFDELEKSAGIIS